MSTKKNIIVVTGAAGGIGMACARVFKDEELVLTEYSQEGVDKAIYLLKQEGINAKGIACDIANKEEVERLKDFASSQGSFKALIHTAGVSGTMKDLRKVYDIDLVATEYLIDSFYELAEQNSVAVLLSSMMAHAVPENKEYDYALQNPQEPASFDTILKFINGNSDVLYNFVKRGVLLLTHKNADRWGAKGARIVSISPGVIETEMALKAAEEHPVRMEAIKQATPLKRNGTPEEIADVASFLVSDAARFITATDILVDGGVIHKIKTMS